MASWQVVSPHVSTQMADWTPTAEILHGELGALFTIEMTRGDRFTCKEQIKTYYIILSYLTENSMSFFERKSS